MIDLTQHINTYMQYEPVSQLSGYVVMVCPAVNYAMHFMQDSETLYTMNSNYSLT